MPVEIREWCLDRHCANIGGEEEYVDGYTLVWGERHPLCKLHACSLFDTLVVDFYSCGLRTDAYNCINAIAGEVYAFALRLCS
jgi:hypothetical protein